MEREMGAGRILLIDDDPDLCAAVVAFLRGHGFAVDVAHDAAVGLATDGDHDAVLLDLGLPGGPGGMEVLAALRQRDVARPVIILTADTAVETVVSAMRDGAWDYVVKPVDRTKLTTTVRNAVERCRLARQVDHLSRRGEASFHGLIGTSSAMRDLCARIRRVARSDVTVALRGESGAGKELVARAIHEESERRAGPFVAINCAAIPDALQESELFGHEKGAFTGAATRRPGRLEQADGGTLFLDEVAELSLSLQAKLLRCLQERRFSRVGGVGELATDFRLVTATHKDLVEEVAAGRFREDLYYRLAVFDLHLPALRERPEDIPLLAHHFLATHARPGQRPRLDAEALEALLAAPWRGNVRELQNAIQHALVVADEGLVRLKDLPPRLRELRREGAVVHRPPAGEWREHAQAEGERLAAPVDPPPAPTVPPSPPVVATALPGASPPRTLDEIERAAVEEVIARLGGNMSAVARELGMGRTTLYRKLHAWGVRVGRRLDQPPAGSRWVS